MLIQHQKELNYLDELITSAPCATTTTKKQILSLCSGDNISYFKLSNEVHRQFPSGIDWKKISNPDRWLVATLRNIIAKSGDELKEEGILIAVNPFLLEIENYGIKGNSTEIFALETIINAIANRYVEIGNSRETVSDFIKSLIASSIKYLEPKKEVFSISDIMSVMTRSSAMKKELNLFISWDDLRREHAKKADEWESMIANLCSGNDGFLSEVEDELQKALKTVEVK